MKIEILRGKVFEYLLEIPKGKVTTYKKIWDLFEVNQRKIWKIIKGNLDTEKYPCYKVLETELKIGFYNWKGGIHGKVQKIKDDWIEVINGKIDPKDFI